MTVHSFRYQISIRTPRVIAAGLTMSFTLMANAGAAIDLSAVESAAGPWEMALHDTERRCGMQLRAVKAESPGNAIGMPAGCRRAMPILMDVSAWSVTPERRLELADKTGNAILSFAPAESDSLLATGPEGETYELVAAGRQRYAQANPTATSPSSVSSPAIRSLPPSPNPAALPATNAPAPQQAQRQSAQAPIPSTPPAGAPTTAVKPFTGRASEIAGRYVILREGGKDVGCMLTLSDQGRGPGGSQRAQLAPACRDNGIVVFDPQGWQIDRGRIALTARKGHKAHFEHHEDGAWWKDPKEGGKPLGIRKMER